MTFRALAALAVATSIAVAGDPAAESAKARGSELRSALKSGTAEEKRSAISACGAVAHALSAAALGPVLSDPSDDLRIAAAEALGTMKGLPEAARALGAGVNVNARKPEILKAVFKAMGQVNHPDAVAALKEFLGRRIPMKDDRESDLVVAGIEALSQIRWKAAVEVMVDVTERQVGIGTGCSEGHHGPVFSALKRGLREFSGREFNMPGEPKAWWKKAGKDLNDDLTPRKK
ncbi:MAG: HEAT repeat domain-containing protein [Candidatus Brocadiae bacterium]|nr:HEAT repeat domain-containing protein [Candidatus Brocadiia bacterium]